jgi:hypothetical protein
MELAHDLNGVEPRDPDRQHSFYVDAGGGRTRLVCSRVDVLRVEPELAEVAFVDTTSAPLQHEHHLVLRAGRRGVYGYNIMTATMDTSINEVRMNTRWDRSILDHAYNWERGAGQQPTYAYLARQQSVQDETWRVDGVNQPTCPVPTATPATCRPVRCTRSTSGASTTMRTRCSGTSGTGSGSGSPPSVDHRRHALHFLRRRPTAPGPRDPPGRAHPQLLPPQPLR